MQSSKTEQKLSLTVKNLWKTAITLTAKNHPQLLMDQNLPKMIAKKFLFEIQTALKIATSNMFAQLLPFVMRLFCL